MLKIRSVSNKGDELRIEKHWISACAEVTRSIRTGLAYPRLLKFFIRKPGFTDSKCLAPTKKTTRELPMANPPRCRPTLLAVGQGWPTHGSRAAYGSSPGFLWLLKAGINYHFQNKFKQLSLLNLHVAIMTRNF